MASWPKAGRCSPLVLGTAASACISEVTPSAVCGGDCRGATREEATANYFKTREPTSLLQRFLSVDEIANVATFLASDLSSGINGSAQLVEGGIIRHV